MKVSIIMPVYNEEKTIQKVLAKIDTIQLGKLLHEIIIVNDGSTDKTKTLITKHTAKKKKVKVIHHENNSGKGAAIKTGIKQAKGDYIVIQDADLEYDPKFLPSLLLPITQGKAKVVYGTRLKRMPNFKQDERTIRFFMHYLGNKFLSFVSSILYGQWITDMETGYKVFPKAAVSTIKATGFEFEAEITAKLMKSGYKITEIPISTLPRGYADGKKLNMFTDGPLALWTIIKYRFIQ